MDEEMCRYFDALNSQIATHYQRTAAAIEALAREVRSTRGALLGGDAGGYRVTPSHAHGSANTKPCSQ